MNVGLGVAAAAMAMDEKDLKPVDGPTRSKNAINPIVHRVNSLTTRVSKIERKRRAPVRTIAFSNGVLVVMEIDATQVELVT